MSATSKAREASPRPVYAVTGEDEAVIAAEVRTLLEDILGPRDASLVVEEYGPDAQNTIDVGAVIDSFTTPPFLVDRRIIVLRDAGLLSKDEAKRIAAVLDPPPPGSVLILAGSRGTIPIELRKVAKAVGDVIDLSIRQKGERTAYLNEHLRLGPVRLSKEAQTRLADQLGGDLGRLGGILGTLASAYGEGVTVDAEMLEPFLGSLGSVPVYDLTGAIEVGETVKALTTVDRLMGPGGISGHEILASLDTMVSRLARLDGADIASVADVMALLSIKSEYPAKKILGLARRLDSETIRRAVALVAQADLDLKGHTGLEERMIIDILVARLSRMLRAGRR
ncbi:MAG: DNA polymerase III subunit delta [Actinomycetes bacterium]